MSESSPTISIAKRLLTASYLLFLGAPVVQAQYPDATVLDGRGALVGRVVDSIGRPLAGSVVFADLIDSAHAGDHALDSDAHGYFRLQDLLPGSYQLMAHMVGMLPLIDTIQVAAGGIDTVQLRLRRDPSIAYESANAELMEASWQPSVTLHRGPAPTSHTCEGVDSIIVTPASVVVTGYKSNSTLPDGLTAQVFRRGNGVVLDLIGISSIEIGNMVSCFGWRATVRGLHPGLYGLSVRLTADPSGPAYAFLLAFQPIDTRRRQGWQVVPPSR